MTISLLQELSCKSLPLPVKGGDHVDAVHILLIAGHVDAEVAKAVRTPTGWMNPTAVVRAAPPQGGACSGSSHRDLMGSDGWKCRRPNCCAKACRRGSSSLRKKTYKSARRAEQSAGMDYVDDEELASTAYVLRTRAKHGHPEALQQAEHLERLLRARLGPTPSSHAPLEITQRQSKPWWKLW